MHDPTFVTMVLAKLGSFLESVSTFCYLGALTQSRRSEDAAPWRKIAVALFIPVLTAVLSASSVVVILQERMATLQRAVDEIKIAVKDEANERRAADAKTTDWVIQHERETAAQNRNNVR